MDEDETTSESDPVPLVAQNSQEAVAYANENGSATTCDSNILVEAEPEGNAPLTLSARWYVVQGQVNATKHIEVNGAGATVKIGGDAPS